jgi:hypothetical protein
MKHTNDGKCKKCLEIIYKFPNPYQRAVLWFVDLQSRHHEAHVSEWGRGEDSQEALFLRGASRAKWKKSAHNWNAAFDIFEMGGDPKNIYESSFYKEVLKPNLPTWLKWYGEPGSPFFELPHVEVATWKEMAASGELKLVE